MNLQKKMLKSAVAGMITFGLVSQLASFNAATVKAATENNSLELAHNAYIFNQKGKRIKNYHGQKNNAYLKKGTSINFSGSIKEVEPNTKKFYLLNEDREKQSWLPYKMIKGQCYYKLSSGGYVKANNVYRIAGHPLYTDQATVKIANLKKNESYKIGVGKDSINLKNGKIYQVDRVTGMSGQSGLSIEYRVRGTKTAFIPETKIKAKPKQQLQTYTQASYIIFTQKAGTYNVDGSARPTTDPNATFAAYDVYPVESATYLWNANDNKAELFYLLKDSWNEPRFYSLANYHAQDFAGLVYVKADTTEYESGPALKPTNTPEQAQKDAKIAVKEDKQELQDLVDQENITPYQSSSLSNLENRFKAALKLAKTTLNSDKATISEVKAAKAILVKTQNDLSHYDKSQAESDAILGATTPYIIWISTMN